MDEDMTVVDLKSLDCFLLYYQRIDHTTKACLTAKTKRDEGLGTKGGKEDAPSDDDKQRQTRGMNLRCPGPPAPKKQKRR